ncbi:SLATT domain-containing protein [Marinifilum flexuosum]|uniref:SLATT domain-containing protein n=1 Tax=Marinifilum flexuosum TaxID=1117708 RepID=UPI002492B43C|nr:SLATT domain-containing protein [Marinifilum flexuosum]
MEEKTNLLRNWKKRIKKAQKAHYKDAHRLKRNKMLIGIPTVVLTTLVGTGIFASLENSGPEDIVYIHPVVLGILSLFASILASLQTFLNYSEKSEKHLGAARKLSSLKKEIQHNLITIEQSSIEMNEFIQHVREKWDEIINEAPLVSEKNRLLYYEKKESN